jgi:hypothetical protein
MVVGGGRSTCAGGGAHRWRGVWPNQGTIDQLNGSESFTRGQGRCAREELENGSLDCSIYAWPRATEVRRRRSLISVEVLSGSRAWKASRATGEANREVGATWARLERAGRGGQGFGSDGGRWRGVLEAKSGELWLRQGLRACKEVRPRPWGCFIGTARARARGGLERTLGRARAGWANDGVPTRVEHVCAFILPEFWRVWSFIRACPCLGQCTKPLLLPISYRSCVGVIGFGLLVSKIWSSQVWSVSQPKPEANLRFCHV